MTFVVRRSRVIYDVGVLYVQESHATIDYGDTLVQLILYYNALVGATSINIISVLLYSTRLSNQMYEWRVVVTPPWPSCRIMPRSICGMDRIQTAHNGWHFGNVAVVVCREQRYILLCIHYCAIYITQYVQQFSGGRQSPEWSAILPDVLCTRPWWRRRGCYRPRRIIGA